jgi:SNF2 family DNA or RNA helicase
MGDGEWREVFTFLHQKCYVDGKYGIGKVERVDECVFCLEVKKKGGGGAITVLYEEGSSTVLGMVKEIATLNDGCVKIGAHFREEDNVLVCLSLLVNPARLMRRVSERGSFPSEELVVSLCTLSFEDAIVHSETEEETLEAYDRDNEFWKKDVLLFPHQLQTVRWILSMESNFPLPISYSSNIALVPKKVFVDTVQECISDRSERRTVLVNGGISADTMGSGKTAVALRVACEPFAGRGEEGKNYMSRASLIIVPINIAGQWMGEMDKFLTSSVSILTLFTARDMKDVTMSSLCNNYDVVLTSFGFLRSCKTYVEAVEAALGNKQRSKVSLSTWANQRNHQEPVLEAVFWKRIIVDEIHNVFSNQRERQHLLLFRKNAMWGLSGTPPHRGDPTKSMYSFLVRKEEYNPNLLSELNSRLIHSSTTRNSIQLPEVKYVRLSETEEKNVETKGRRATVATMVKMFCFDQETSDEEKMSLLSEMKEREASLRSIEATLSHMNRAGEGKEVCDAIERQANMERSSITTIKNRVQELEELSKVQSKKVVSSSKMKEIKNLIESKRGEPIILFIQWKTMIKNMKSFLKTDANVFTLEGNMNQRIASLKEFEREGGVLLLCLDDSFAGLNLPNCRTIVFAHAIVGSQNEVVDLEKQAISRCCRYYGKHNEVEVYSFIVAESVEEDLWENTHKGMEGRS